MAQYEDLDFNSSVVTVQQQSVDLVIWHDAGVRGQSDGDPVSKMIIQK